jgi:septal ring factor EnvC (AmiA/AmiB activator)
MPNKWLERGLAVGLAITAFAGPPGWAQAPLRADDESDPLEKLERLEKEIGDDKAKVDALSRWRARLVEDQRRMSTELVRVAASAQAHERDLGQIEQQLAGLETREAEASRALTGKRGKLASMLAVLQRMGREPPPALIVRPDDAAVAARSAMLLSSVVPLVQHEARRLASDLTELRKLRQEVAAKRLGHAAAANALQRDRRTLEGLIKQKRELAAKTAVTLDDTSTRLTALARQAKDLRGLLASLDDDARRPRGPGGQLVVDRIAAAGAARVASLDGLRGLLALPATGELAASFGSEDGFGGHLAGILLQTRSGAQVTSPCDGKVLFAGPFRGYGQMLIIGVSGGYHVLLAGLKTVDGVVGQEVLAGEPVGSMGVPAPRTGSGASGARDERLYIEFRRNGTPIDPAPWFAALREKASG